GGGGCGGGGGGGSGGCWASTSPLLARPCSARTAACWPGATSMAASSSVTSNRSAPASPGPGWTGRPVPFRLSAAVVKPSAPGRLFGLLRYSAAFFWFLVVVWQGRATATQQPGAPKTKTKNQNKAAEWRRNPKKCPPWGLRGSTQQLSAREKTGRPGGLRVRLWM